MPKPEKETERPCAKCHEVKPIKETRGDVKGKWLCVSCWEETYSQTAPLPSGKQVKQA